MRTARNRMAVALFLIGLATLLSGAGEVGAQDEIRLGAFMPISGLSADVGAQIKNGVEVALERMAPQGLAVGRKPHRVRVMWYDTEGRVTSASTW